jgi:hypothetical protein
MCLIVRDHPISPSLRRFPECSPPRRHGLPDSRPALWTVGRLSPLLTISTSILIHPGDDPDPQIHLDGRRGRDTQAPDPDSYTKNKDHERKRPHPDLDCTASHTSNLISHHTDSFFACRLRRQPANHVPGQPPPRIPHLHAGGLALVKTVSPPPSLPFSDANSVSTQMTSMALWE